MDTLMYMQLVDVTTEDGLELTGALSLKDDTPSPYDSELIIMMHGNSSNFYGPFFRGFAKRFDELGYSTLIVNNRGHDVVNRASGTRDKVSYLAAFQGELSQYYGTALESLADSPLDWRAWIDFAWNTLGKRKIILWGHSRGAVKAGYYLGTVSDDRIVGGILASPPWFSYSRWMKSPQALIFKEHLSRAQELVESGDEQALMWVKVPMEYASGAANYLDKYGPEEKYNVIDVTANTEVPVLAITGSAEVEQRFAFDKLPQAFNEIGVSNPLVRHLNVPDGDHFYSGQQEFVFHEIRKWVREISE